MVEKLKWLTMVRRLGLTYAEKFGLRLAWSASGIEFLTNSSSVSVIMHARSSSSREDAYVAVFFNDETEPRYKLRLHKGENIYPLLQSEKAQFVKIRLVKLTEEQYGNVWIKSLASDGPLWRSEAAKRNLLFIGDSISAGYGVNGRDGDLFQTQTEDVTKAYAYKAAQLLNADYTIIAYSGNGVLSHWLSETANEPITQALMPDIFPYRELKELYQEQKQLADFTDNKLLRGSEAELLKGGRFALKAKASQAFHSRKEVGKANNAPLVKADNSNFLKITGNSLDQAINSEKALDKAKTEPCGFKSDEFKLNNLALSSLKQSSFEPSNLEPSKAKHVSSTAENQSKLELVNMLNEKALPNLIICNLGTNDATYTRKNAAREAKFIENYIAFVTKLKAAFPKTNIILAYGVMEQTLCAAVKEAAVQSSVSYLPLPIQNIETGLGIAGHPSAETQRQIAELIAERLAALC